MSEQVCECGAIDFTECGCSLTDSDCITIEGSGNLNPLTPIVRYDPADDNLASSSTGMLVKLPPNILSPPRCSAYHNANQSINSDVGTVLSLNAEYYDTDTMHDTSTNNSRVTFMTTGIYLVTFLCAWEGNTSGDRLSLIRKNGNEFLGGVARRALNSATYELGMSVTVQEFFEEDEYVEAYVRQDSGGALNLLATRYSPILSATFRRGSLG